MINISETCEGTVNLNHLRTAMQVWKDVGIPMIGCFSAASNITGNMRFSFKYFWQLAEGMIAHKVISSEKEYRSVF